MGPPAVKVRSLPFVVWRTDKETDGSGDARLLRRETRLMEPLADEEADVQCLNKAFK